MKRFLVPFFMLLLAAGCRSVPEPETHAPTVIVPQVATFSIVAFDPETGDLGVAVESKFLAVGAVVPFARAGVGAIATQAAGNTKFGPRGLELLGQGKTPEEAVKLLTESDPGREYRQLGIVDASGNAAAYTGAKPSEWKGHVTGPNYACQGNILAGEAVVKAVAAAFENSSDLPLPERLVKALSAGQEAGGDKRGRQSAALLVVRKNGGYAGHNDRYVDLRVDDHEKPIVELARLLALHRKTFGDSPLPNRERGRVVIEKLPAEKTSESPAAVFMKALDDFAQKKFEAVYNACTEDFRNRKTLEEFVKEKTRNHEAAARYIKEIEYVETEFTDDDNALVFFSHVASSSNSRLPMKKEKGAWKMMGF